jgi:hypothetical protein
MKSSIKDIENYLKTLSKVKNPRLYAAIARILAKKKNEEGS